MNRHDRLTKILSKVFVTASSTITSVRDSINEEAFAPRQDGFQSSVAAVAGRRYRPYTQQAEAAYTVRNVAEVLEWVRETNSPYVKTEVVGGNPSAGMVSTLMRYAAMLKNRKSGAHDDLFAGLLVALASEVESEMARTLTPGSSEAYRKARLDGILEDARIIPKKTDPTYSVGEYILTNVAAEFCESCEEFARKCQPRYSLDRPQFSLHTLSNRLTEGGGQFVLKRNILPLLLNTQFIGASMMRSKDVHVDSDGAADESIADIYIRMAYGLFVASTGEANRRHIEGHRSRNAGKSYLPDAVNLRPFFLSGLDGQCAVGMHERNPLQTVVTLLLLLGSDYISPSTPIWLNAGRFKNGSLFANYSVSENSMREMQPSASMVSCFVSPVMDNTNDITTAIAQTLSNSSGGGGVGLIMETRPGGSHVGRGGVSPTVAQYLSVFNSITGTFDQCGKRPASIAIGLSVGHKDITYILDAHKPRAATGALHGIFTSVIIPDVFMQAAAADSKWLLSGPAIYHKDRTYLKRNSLKEERNRITAELAEFNAKHGCNIENIAKLSFFDTATYSPKIFDSYKLLGLLAQQSAELIEAVTGAERAQWEVVSARELYGRIISTAASTGKLWLVFSDNLNKGYPLIGNIPGVNLCQEIGIESHTSGSIKGYEDIALQGSCVISNVNLARMWHMEDGVKKVDYEMLDYCTMVTLDVLNAVTVGNMYPCDDQLVLAMGRRPVGVGTMGMWDLMFELGVQYDSIEALKHARNISFSMMKAAWRRSRNTGRYAQDNCKGYSLLKNTIVPLPSASIGVEDVPTLYKEDNVYDPLPQHADSTLITELVAMMPDAPDFISEIVKYKKEHRESHSMFNAVTLTQPPTASSAKRKGVLPDQAPDRFYPVVGLSSMQCEWPEYRLEKALADCGIQRTSQLLESIAEHEGSVQHLLTSPLLSEPQKEAFAKYAPLLKTATEIQTLYEIMHALVRQVSIDQAMSTVLHIGSVKDDVSDLAALIIEAHKAGLKTLYYIKTTDGRNAFEYAADPTKDTAQEEEIVEGAVCSMDPNCEACQ